MANKTQPKNKNPWANWVKIGQAVQAKEAVKGTTLQVDPKTGNLIGIGVPGGGLGQPYTPPAAPRVPAVSSPASTPAAPPAGSATPLADDAQATAARAQALFDAAQATDAAATAGKYDATDLADAIRRLETAKPTEENSAKNAANAAGLASSSYLQSNLGNIGANYARQEGDLQTAYDRRQAARAAQTTAANSQEGITEQSITAALADRAGQRDQAAAADNALVAASRPARIVNEKNWKGQGLTTALVGGKVVVRDAKGNVIPGAYVAIAGNKRIIHLPKGT